MSESTYDKEQKRRRFVRVKEATGIHIAKLIAFVAIAAIAVFTAQNVNALLLGALTYAVGIVFDMMVLSRDNKAVNILWISYIQWGITILIGALTVGVFVLLVTYDAIVYARPSVMELLNSNIYRWIPVFMFIIAIISSLLEIYYSIPYDD